MDPGAMLLKLQDADLEIMRSEKRLEEMPEKRAILETRRKRAEVEALRVKAAELVSRLERGVSKDDDEVTQIRAKMESEQQKLMSGDVTNPKEVQHITREMDALRRRAEKIEIDEIALLERVEKAKSQVEKVDAALEQLAKREERVTEEFKSKGGELQSTLERLHGERNALADGLPSDLLARYEKTRSTKSGMGVGELVDGGCTACRMELPTQRVQELIDAAEEIATCPACRRLLVIRIQEHAE